MLPNGKNFNYDTRKAVLCVLLVLVCCSSLFAAPDTGALTTTVNTWTEKLVSFLSSGWIKAICLIALVAEGIGIVVGGQQGGGGAVFKKLAPWIVGTIILLMASTICNYMIGDIDFSMGGNS